MKAKLQQVPQKPGSYQMKDAQNNIIYVGKAKNLKARLTSYFTGSHDYKTTKMLTQIVDFEYLVTASELEAYIVEIDWIKKYQPRYNILLTDDKSYPYIEITQEKHPKLIVTRKPKKKNTNRFGPYPNVKAARETLRILNQLYPLRKCGQLPKNPCLYYHIGQCLAPCIHPIDSTTYESIKSDIVRFLKGHTQVVIQQLKEKMQTASEQLAFERALEYKTAIESIETTTEKQAVNLADFKPRDVIGIAFDETWIAIEILFLRSGKIIARDQTVMPYYQNPLDTALDFLGQWYQEHPLPKEILVNDAQLIPWLEGMFEVTIRHPQRGKKKALNDIALINAQEALKMAKDKHQKRTEKTFGALDALAELLSIPTPYHIEAFDNSHLFGSHPVSALVVFKNGTKETKSYRKYKLDASVKQAGDTQQMQEVIYRRYRRVLLEQLPLPDLLLVDGGIHQMHAAQSVLKQLDLSIPIAGITKSAKHTIDHLIDAENNTIELIPASPVYVLLAAIQDEAHRFAITFHKDLRQKGVYDSVLDHIPGIGKVYKSRLLNHFKSIQRIKTATDESLLSLGLSKSAIANLRQSLQNNTDE